MSESDGTDWLPDGRGWFVRHAGDSYAISRRRPVRWDVVARAAMPDVGRRRLAHAIRQDMWRMLRDLRGFAPVVEVTRTETGCDVRAGGRVDGPVPAGVSGRIAGMLSDPSYRAAWMRSAGHRAGQGGA
ncbi:hypothetical protein [Jannaschia sp. 2305UL9-9]|uniref:hypothetical protein n=1 Tax=Jannaschia sp. 2305UL9-9 TaxID=3121638 RepID=UPI003527C93A